LLQAEGWIDDKLKVANEDNFKEVSDLQGKMRKLQKHQAFEAEIVANTDRIDNIKQVGRVEGGRVVCVGPYRVMICVLSCCMNIGNGRIMSMDMGLMYSS